MNLIPLLSEIPEDTDLEDLRTILLASPYYGSLRPHLPAGKSFGWREE